MPLIDTVLDKEDDTEIKPAPRAQVRTGKRRTLNITTDALDHLDRLANSQAPKQEAIAQPKQEKAPLGVLGTIKEGAKGTLRALGATVDTAQGDEAGVVNAAKEQAEAPKDPRLESFLSDIAEKKKALTDPSLWEGIKTVGSAAIKNPAGFGLMIAEQAPNSVAALGAGAIGALVGSIAGPAGTVAGGLAGLGLANVGLETGNKALEAAADQSFTSEEQSRVRKEGLTKGAVITGVDALTLGATKWITGATRRAVETATTRTLADHGVDVANAAARKAAMSDPAIKESVKVAQDLAKQSADKLGKRLARTGGAVALETVGEGAGEYLGEFAATGKADTIEAVIEAFAGFGQSAGEIALTSALNKKGMQRLFDNPETAEKIAQEETKNTGIPHETVPSPTEPDKYVAVPKTRSPSGIEFERDEQGNLTPVSSPSTQADFNLANKPGFQHTAEDKARERELAKAREEAYAKNPIIAPAAPTQSPVIAGKPVTEMSNSALIATVNRGSVRLQKIASDELTRRDNEGFDPQVADAPETPADTVSRIVATSAEKAQEDAKKAQPILTPAPKAVKPTTASKTKSQTVPAQKKTASWVIREKNTGKVVLETFDKKKVDALNTEKYEAVPILDHLVGINNDIKNGKIGNPIVEIAKPKPVVQPTKPEVIKNAKAQPTEKVPETKPVTAGTERILPQGSKTAGKQERTVSVPPVLPNAEGTGVADKESGSKDAPYLQLLGLKTTKLLTTSGGRAVHAVSVSPSFRNKHFTTGRGSVPIAQSPSFELKLKSDVTGVPQDSGYLLIDKREQNKMRFGSPDAEKATRLESLSGKSGKDGKPIPTDSQTIPSVSQTVSHDIRPHIDALIKRRAAARQIGKERTFDKALADAKAMLAGEKISPARFKNAAKLFTNDKATADILSSLQAKAEESNKATKSKPAFSRSKTVGIKSPAQSRVESVVNTVKAKWKNAPQIVILSNITDAPAEVRAENERQLSMGATGEPEGFVHGNKVYIVSSQIKTPGDVVRVLLHESLGHYGMRGVFGAELQTILRQVAALRRNDIDAKAKQYGLDVSKEADRLTAAEEVLAEMAQGNPQNGLVRRAIAAIHKWLRANIPGFQNLRLSDSEIIQDILVPARRFVESGGKAAPMQGVMFSRSSTATPSAFRAHVDKALDSLIYNFQDRFKPLKDIQERAGPVAEDEDAALAEERYSGIVRARTDQFDEQLREPLLKAIHDSGVSYEDTEEYLHALHAPSRNAAMREINPTKPELDAQTSALEKQRDSLSKDPEVTEYLKLRRELRQAQGDIEDGIADESLAVAIQRDISRLKQSQNVRDYTGALEKLKALRLVKPFDGDNTALSGMSDAESKAILAKIDANGTRKALERVSALIDAITSKTRQIYADSGLEKADTIDAWNKKYEHYVPLHRDEVSGNTMPRIGQGFNIRGKESKRATGSTKDVTHILAHVVAQHEAAIIRSEKARVDRTLFQFAQRHPDTSLWTLDDAPMLRTVDQTSGLVVERVDPTYKNRPNVLTLKIDGEEHTITFNEQNLEGMRLAASMKNLSSEQLGEVTQMVGKLTRFLAMMNTTANPVFTARNFLRDLQTAYVNLTDTALADKKKEVFRDVRAAIKGMWDLSRGKKTSQWAKYAEEFKAAGGQTGWMDHYKDIGARAENLKSELEILKPGRMNAAHRAFRSLQKIIEDANNAVESGTRLSAYVNARRSGISEAKAAQIAKNLTVNFNTHGAKGVELNAWYMFMNASIQGTARLAKALSHRQVQKIVGGIILSGFLMDILARSMAGDEDDDGENDYDQLPEHTKAMNFVLMVNNRPVTIPMPYGYNFFASAGRKISEVMFRPHYSPVKSAADLASVFLDAFSPTGQAGSFLQYLSPTVTDPFVQWSENKNFAGNPLRRPQSPFGVPNPEYQMGFKSTSAPAKWLAEALNNETGGNEVRPGFINVNPAFFDFAVSSIAGGAGRTYLQTVSAPMKIAADDEVKAREVPFLNIFLGAKPEYQTEKKYFEAVRNVETAKDELKTYRQKGDTEMVKQILEDHGHEIRLQVAAKETKNLLNRLKKRDLALDKNNPPNRRELKKQIEEQRREAMARFNKKYRQAVESH